MEQIQEKLFSLISKNTARSLVFFFLLPLFFSSCGTIPIMGRKQLLLVSNQEILSLSDQQYSSFIDNARVDKNSPNAKMVERTGRRISMAVEEFLLANGLGKEINNFKWEFNYVKSPEINAFCMPGGKIVVFEGIMQAVQNENDLAVVMSHEVAHAVAKHSNERMSQNMLLKAGNVAVGVVLSGKSQETQELAAIAFGLGSQLGITLPYSRKHEYEADELGLYFMALAGYDPSKADRFWINMSRLGKNTKLEMMSTHPSDENRIKRIQKNAQKAIEYSEKENATLKKRKKEKLDTEKKEKKQQYHF